MLFPQTERWFFVAALLFAGTASARGGDPAAPSPAKANLRNDFERLKLTVHNQGQRGACQVFAMVGVIEFQLAQRGQKVDLSEQFIMWAANEATGLNRVRGFNPDLLVAGLKQYGICTASRMPYVPRDEPFETPNRWAILNAKARTSSEIVSIKHWTSNIGLAERDIEEITEQLENGTPVTVTLCWPEGSMEQIVDKQHFLIEKNIDGTSKNGHGVILVGYGRDASLNGGGYFIFRNSWGLQFADQGYARVTFEFAKKYGIDAYIVSIQ